MGFTGQFCGGDPMTQVQQSQTQAQLAALQQQNSMLNQQLQTQAQSHIHHLQQLSSIHQPPHTATPPVTTSHIPSQQPAPEPPTQVVAPSHAIWCFDILKPRSGSSRGEEYCGIQLSGDGRQANREASPIHLTTCSAPNSTSSTINTSFCYSYLCPRWIDQPPQPLPSSSTQISLLSLSVSVQTP